MGVYIYERYSVFGRNVYAKIIIVLLVLAFSGMLFGVGGEPAESEDVIRFTADQLEIDNQTNIAELTGNVRVVQGTTVITSNKLRMVFVGGLTRDKREDSEQDRVKEIAAWGNVHIVFEEASAQADEAVYRVAEKTLTLSGKSARVVSQNNVISGSKIIMDRNTGLTKVIGGVEGVYFPADGQGIR